MIGPSWSTARDSRSSVSRAPVRSRELSSTRQRIQPNARRIRSTVRSSPAPPARGVSPPTRSMNSSSRLLPTAPERSSSIVPCATMRPRAMTPMCVDRRSTISRMWDVRKMVPPRDTNACRRSLICLDATASMPSNGSSRKSSRGAGSSAAASESFLRIPCEKSTTSVFPASARFITPSRSSARLRAVGSSMPWTWATNSSVSAAVSRSNSARSSGTTPVRRLTATGIRDRIDAEDAHGAAGGPEQARSGT